MDTLLAFLVNSTAAFKIVRITDERLVAWASVVGGG
jgi:hypothetical protein